MNFEFFKKVLAAKALILDFDGTVANPECDENGNYIRDENGFIKATHMDKELFRKLVQTAIKNKVPVYFVTGRADIPQNRDLFKEFINSVDGFYRGLGGFKENSIHFISQMVMENGMLVWKEVTTKVAVIQTIHQTELSHLSPTDFLFVDDIPRYIDPVAALGYGTLLVEPNNLSHFDLATDFVTVEQVLDVNPEYT